MYPPTFNITAFEAASGKRIHLFTWCKTAILGIERAKREAVEFGMDKMLSDYRAEPIGEESKCS